MASERKNSADGKGRTRNKVGIQLYIVAGAILIGFAALITVGNHLVGQIRMGSALYGKVMDEKDLLADILPPPVYLLEAYQVCLVMDQGSDGSGLAAQAEKLAALSKDFAARKLYWDKKLAGTELGNLMDSQVYPTGNAFLDAVNTQFVPLIVKGKAAEARELLKTRIATAYAEHRSAVDRMVAASNTYAGRIDAESREKVRRGLGLILALALAIGGLLAGAVLLIRKRIVAGLTEAESSAVNVSRLTSMIDGSITNFMTCDLDLKITSANPAVIKLISRYQNDLRRIFPSLDANNLIGACIDGFHKSPEHQRRLLRDVRNLPFQTEIQVGDLQFGLNLSALYDSEGNHIGNGVEWIDNNARGAYRREVDSLLKSMREGDLSKRGDEKSMDKVYQPMLAGINHIIEAVVEPLKEVKEKLAMVAAGDLSAYVTGEYKGDHQMLKNGLNDSLDSLNDILGQVAVAADQVANGSRQVSDSSQALSQGATEQASSLEQITASMTEMAGQTKQNAENATQANQLASAARDSAEKGNQLMQDMVKAMTDIDESSQNISKIIKAIDEIAFQTNLLALNAAVEAARAGVHGKGFAVVAEEVRNLAARSAKAAKETTEMIEGSIKKVNMGSGIAKKTADSLLEMVSGVGKVTDLVGEIAAASNEQAQGIGQVNQGLTQLDQVTQQNTSSAEQSAAASQELSSQSSQLKQTLTKFRLKDDQGRQEPAVRQHRENAGERNGSGHRPQPSPTRQNRNSDWQPARPAGLGGTIHSNGTKPVISLDDKEFGRF